MSYPTDLSPAEEQIALSRLHELAEKFTAAGALRTSEWRDVFQRTWRHSYVPTFYPEVGAPCLLSIDPNRRGEWLEAVYSDQTLLTKVVQVPMSRALRPGSYPMLTSSSTLPSLVLTMLEELDVTEGCRVLEVGTGSGCNAALLCERLGSEGVTSVDIDPELVDLAGERLAANGYTPTLATVDGASGYPAGAPYDRIIATCSVPAIPPAWLQQAAPGAVIVVDVQGKLGGTLARLTVNADGMATGRFLPLRSSFMWLRHTVDAPAPQPSLRLDDEPVSTFTQVDPTLIRDNLFSFVAQWHLPEANWGVTAAEDGEASTYRSSPRVLAGRRPTQL
jgi:protein-L-isoaspartate O-methyltransferase